MNTKHTPGPWLARYERDANVSHYRVGTTDYQTIATVWYENEDANARLIAAAPELLESLRMVLRWMPVYPKAADAIVGGRDAYMKSINAAKSAIAKATGGQP